MPEDTKLKTCSTCAVWGTEYRLANRITSCAGLGFDSSDECSKWTSKYATGVQAVVRVREPSLAEILQDKDLRAPWVTFQEKLKATTAYYNEDDGHYYYFFDGDSIDESARFAETLSKDEYLQRQGRLFPLLLANLEDADKDRFKKIAKVAKAE